MSNISVIGYPRIGANRELKFWTEDYFRGKLSAQGLEKNAEKLRAKHWKDQQDAGIGFVPSNDFSFYDNMLDTVFLLGAQPASYRGIGLTPLETYFAAARGYQGKKGDARALPMKKWFNTNYHYLVPQLDAQTEIRLAGEKPFSEFEEAEKLGILTKPSIIGPFTFLKLSEFHGGKSPADFAAPLAAAYREILNRFQFLGAQWIQIEEPALVTDCSEVEIELFASLYREILAEKGSLKVLLQTYFGDIRDAYETVTALDFDGIGLDFIEGIQTEALVKKHGFPQNKLLFAGVVNGRNIWRNDYAKTLSLLNGLPVEKSRVVIGTSCSLLHVPYTVENETLLAAEHKVQFAFAQEKLTELKELERLFRLTDFSADAVFAENVKLHASRKEYENKEIRARIAALSDDDFTRRPDFYEREKIQKKELGLPVLPTTTIGSFPQTKEVKALRSKLRRGEIDRKEYDRDVREKIAACISLQEELGLDVLVHGEFERSDMVEYFGEHLSGFLFTQKAWVQSYGTRCVKPPIIWSDVSRTEPITVTTSVYAQSLTKKPVKGMLTGPVTILNWSFPREDITRREMAFQIALAIRAEVLDLEKAGLRVIQIDEAALKEKLPLRRADRHSEYLDWAIPAFRLVHSGVQAATQIHTHMCYSEFGEIVNDIDDMDADVISFEASRSNLEIVDALNRAGFKTEVGPGVYDIHSPRIPSQEEIETEIRAELKKIPKEKLWVNPDCGLKTRAEDEATPSLRNLVAAAKAVRNTLA